MITVTDHITGRVFTCQRLELFERCAPLFDESSFLSPGIILGIEDHRDLQRLQRLVCQDRWDEAHVLANNLDLSVRDTTELEQKR